MVYLDLESKTIFLQCLMSCCREHRAASNQLRIATFKNSPIDMKNYNSHITESARCKTTHRASNAHRDAGIRLVHRTRGRNMKMSTRTHAHKLARMRSNKAHSHAYCICLQTHAECQ